MIMLYGSLRNFTYFAKSGHSKKTKLMILLIWIKINFKFIFLKNLFSLKSERIFGYKINAFNYGDIRYLFEEIFYKSEYLFKSENEKPVIFDCGANIGFATIFFKWIYPKSEIYAFEPDKQTFEMLKRNILQNKLTDVHLYNCALSDKEGTLNFFVDNDNPGSLLMSTRKERISENKVIVKCITISSLIKKNKIGKIDFLKMDIEGSEKEAIKDLSETGYLKMINKLIIEYHHKIKTYDSDLGSFLKVFEKYGFEYQLDAKCSPISSENQFQDVLIYFYK